MCTIRELGSILSARLHCDKLMHCASASALNERIILSRTKHDRADPRGIVPAGSLTVLQASQIASSALRLAR